MTPNQLDVIANRIASFPGETWEQIVDRVTDKVIQDEYLENREYYKKAYTWLLGEMIFLPNSPCLRNFGANEGSGSACFVLPVEDNRRSIFNTLADAVDVQAFGGGTGFNFSNLRPKGATIKSTNGQSSGAISFMEIYDFTLGTVIKQGGVRAGACMGILNCDHPDILDFLEAKQHEGRLSNFNLSVGITDDFMYQVKKDGPWDLKFGGKVYKSIRAKYLWDKICEGIHRNGEPGVVFLDTVNKGSLVKIEATNPCGEQPLPPYTSCVLGSMNLSEWIYLSPEHQELATSLAVRFLDSVINVNTYPIRKIEEETKRYRNIGLGVMGFADILVHKGIIYGSSESLDLIDEIGEKLKSVAYSYSAILGKAKGYAPIYRDAPVRRNMCCLSVAPTGTLSLLADVCSGIEPLFAKSFTKKCMDKEITVVPTIAAQYPGRKALVTADEVKPIDHIKVQAEWQIFIDAAISKTINVANDFKEDKIGRLLRFAWRRKCKGLTIYRDGSRTIQAQSSDCPECGGKLTKIEGCETCHSCGWSKCSIK